MLFCVMLNFMNKKVQELPLADFVKEMSSNWNCEKCMPENILKHVWREAKIILKLGKCTVPSSSAVQIAMQFQNGQII